MIDKHLIFIFFDGIGLGEKNSDINPFASSKNRFLSSILDGHQLLEETAGFENQILLFRPLDTNLGVKGTPQSATGQAAIITGKNIPGMHKGHYGPKPNGFIREKINEDNLFISMDEKGISYTMVNAYPDSFLEQIESGRRLPGTFGMSYIAAGNTLKTKNDLIQGNAVSADYTGQGWHEHLGLTSIPIITLQDAAQRLETISKGVNFTFFEIWLTDIFGHRQAYENAIAFLEATDIFLTQLIEFIDIKKTTILITSDHGNMEDLSSRKHTRNQVPGIVIGNSTNQRYFKNMTSLTDITPAILDYFSR